MLDSFHQLENMRRLSLRENRLVGNFPMFIFKLGRFDSTYNNFKGEINVDFGKLRPRWWLTLGPNEGLGGMKYFDSLLNRNNLELLELAGLHLRRGILDWVGNLTKLRALKFQYTSISGSLPSSIGNLHRLTIFSLVGNNLMGMIPESIVKLSNLVYLNLGFNSFSGIIPRSIGKLFYSNPSRKKDTPSESIGQSESFEKVSYERLFKATDGFSSQKIIGAGSFALFFKGVLDEEGTNVAIKVLNLQQRGGSKSFIAECEALRNIHHRNLVKIISSCSSVNFQGNNFKALVYDFMPNGSLETLLHSCKKLDHMPPHNLCQLDLIQRISIAKDEACALDYLHNHCGNVVVHYDLKPSNILLYVYMVAHIGDFGLAKILTLEQLPNANRSS
ncbi:unnamed protein product [Lactuca saligna]|uniref:Protein kinase domain-containing protein n=1 Tax=Lactuca saligna TaxID=75948 RepID=A0AA35VRN3_LACSI|nr:unnamed protein product [Lactuca saligna]